MNELLKSPILVSVFMRIYLSHRSDWKKKNLKSSLRDAIVKLICSCEECNVKALYLFPHSPH